MSRSPLGGIYAITDRRRCPALPARVARIAAAHPGGAVFGVREKDLDGGPLLALVRAIIAAARPHGCAVLVNDRIDVALAAGADGVHLPEAGFSIGDARALLGPDAIIGTSRHSADGVAEADAAGADLIVCGPVWPTPSKTGAPMGLDAFAAAAARARRAAVYAIGGVTTEERAAAARDAGARGVAGIRAYFGS